MSTLGSHTPVATSSRPDPQEDRSSSLMFEAWSYFHTHKKTIYGALAVLVVLVVALVGYVLWQQGQEEAAEDALAQAILLYEDAAALQPGDERDEALRTALEGTETTPGLNEIADEYGSTRAGNLAQFYAGAALYELDQDAEALDYFEDFEGDENILSASALASAAAAYDNQGNYERAAELYERAAADYPSELTAPRFLLNAGRAYLAADALGEAEDALETLQEEYEGTEEATTAGFYLAQIQARQRS